MTAMRMGLRDTPATWIGRDLRGRDEWIGRLGPAQAADRERARAPGTRSDAEAPSRI